MKFRPLHDRVLVRRVESEDRSAGGIIIPDNAQEKPKEGEIVAAGGGARSENGTVTPLDVKTGDRVLFGKWSGDGSEARWRRAPYHERVRHHVRYRGRFVEIEEEESRIEELQENGC